MLFDLFDIIKHFRTRPYDVEVEVINRSLTTRPILEYNRTSWAQNTLNPSWLPLPGEGNEGGGLFFRTLAAAETTTYNTVGFVKALTTDGLKFPRVTPESILRDSPHNRTEMNAGADPRAAFRG